jgi:hypothetical protein
MYDDLDEDWWVPEPNDSGCMCYDMGPISDWKPRFWPVGPALWYGPERGWEPVKEKKP